MKLYPGSRESNLMHLRTGTVRQYHHCWFGSSGNKWLRVHVQYIRATFISPVDRHEYNVTHINDLLLILTGNVLLERTADYDTQSIFTEWCKTRSQNIFLVGTTFEVRPWTYHQTLNRSVSCQIHHYGPDYVQFLVADISQQPLFELECFRFSRPVP